MGRNAVERTIFAGLTQGILGEQIKSGRYTERGRGGVEEGVERAGAR